MSDNTSGTAGFLTPLSSPIYDNDLDDAMHDTIVGVTGLLDDYVVPRWQPDSDGAELPPWGTDWCAQGIASRDPDAFAAEMHDSTGLGFTSVQRKEELVFLLSFYGKNADRFESIFRAAMQIAQNRWALTAVGIVVIDLDPPVLAPELVKMQWLRRVDVRMNCRRSITHDFGVQNLAGASVTIQNDITTGDLPPQDASYIPT